MSAYSLFHEDTTQYGLFDDAGTPREVRWMGEVLALVGQHGYDRSAVDKSRYIFSGSRDTWCEAVFDTERKVWVISPIAEPDVADVPFTPF